MAHILAIDTSAEYASVALTMAGAIVERSAPVSASHSQQLLGLVDTALEESGLSLAQLDAIAVCQGPGSFTGLRIGIAAAQGLAFAAELPLLAVSSLELVALRAIAALPAQDPCPVLATHDARMDQLYCASFHWDGQALQRQGDEVVCDPGEILATLSVAEAAGAFPGVIAGSGLNYIDAFPPVLQGLADWQYQPDCTPAAAAMLTVAQAQLERGACLQPEALQPVYLRNPRYRRVDGGSD